MTAPEQPVTDWMRGARTFTPQMRLRVAGPPEAVLGILAEALDSSGFKVLDRDTDGFRARWLDWWGLAGWLVAEPDHRRTVLQVTAVADATGTDVSVAVRSGGTHRAARRRGTEGLNRAVAEAERRGLGPVVEPWRPA